MSPEPVWPLVRLWWPHTVAKPVIRSTEGTKVGTCLVEARPIRAAPVVRIVGLNRVVLPPADVAQLERPLRLLRKR
jgi:hypothetical protein